MTKPNRKKLTDPAPTLVFPSIAATSAATGIPVRVLRSWKAASIAGFDPSGRVYLQRVLTAVFGRGADELPEGTASWRDALLRAQAQRQELKLQVERSRLIDRAWMASKLNLAGLGMHAAYHKSIAEHPTRFAAAAGDVAACREVLRGIWDDLFHAHQALAEHFAETTTSNSTTDENETHS